MQNGTSGGLLGPHFDPFVMPVAGKMPANSKPMTVDARFDRRLDLLSRLESDYAAQARAKWPTIKSCMVRPSGWSTARKWPRSTCRPNRSRFTKPMAPAPLCLGCLLARRLVETGVPFIEVVADGWDTHFDNFDITKKLGATVDQPFGP